MLEKIGIMISVKLQDASSGEIIKTYEFKLNIKRKIGAK